MKEILVTTCVVTCVLLFIFLSNQFVRFLTLISQGHLAISALMHILLLESLFLLGYLLPLGLFFGILFAYGRLYTDNEMTVLQACGVSQSQILGMTLKIALGISALVAFLVLWVSPKVMAYQKQMMNDSGEQLLLDTIIPGRFQSLAKGQQVFYVEDISAERRYLNHLFVAQLQTPEKAGDLPTWVITTSDQASQWNNETSGRHFVVGKQGYRYSGIPGSNNFDIMKFNQFGVELLDTPPPLQLSVKALPTSALWFDKNKNLSFEAEWQWRWSMPMVVIISTLLAVPLSVVKPRQGRFGKLLPSALLYIVYANMLFIARDWVEGGLISSSIGLLVIHVPILLLATILLIGERGMRKFIHYFTAPRIPAL